MPVFAVVYRYTDEKERRERSRPTHREFLSGLGAANLCAGPFGPDEEADALLLFRAASRDGALAMTAADPFRTEGLVADVQVRHWLPALGGLAAELGRAPEDAV